MGKLFGTDGVRGVAGKDLTCELALQIGRGTAAVLTSLDGHRPKILDSAKIPVCPAICWNPPWPPACAVSALT